MKTTLTAATHNRIKGQYDWCGGATITQIEFLYKGVRHVAIRFWRADMGTRGVEIYTIDATDGMQELLRYARTDSTATGLDRLVIRQIDRARGAINIDPSCTERFSLIELH